MGDFVSEYAGVVISSNDCLYRLYQGTTCEYSVQNYRHYSYSDKILTLYVVIQLVRESIINANSCGWSRIRRTGDGDRFC